MRKRAKLLTVIVACTLLVVLAFAAAACGSTDETTTTAAPATTTTTAAATTTSAAGTETTAGSMTVPSIQMTQELAAYLAQMQTLFGSLMSMPDTSNPLAITDVTKVTDAQIQTYEEALTQTKGALDGLKALKPPAELAAFQETLVGLIASEIDIATKAIDALKSKDQAAFDAAKAESEKLAAQMTAIFEQLAPLLMGGTATS